MQNRGFLEVSEPFIKYKKKVAAHGKTLDIAPETFLPKRADVGSAGYDFYTPVDIMLLPGETKVIWTNVKAFMQPNEVLLLFIRSSVGVKQNVTLANGTGVIDVSYFENKDNDGNIGIALRNNTGQAKEFKAGERIAQGIFMPYLVADEDEVMGDERKGGFGSSGKE